MANTIPETTRAVILHGELCNAAVNFDTYRILQRHCAVSLPHHGFLVYISDRSNVEITHNKLIFTSVMQNHGNSRKSPHDQNHGKRHGAREYMIILQC